MYAYDNITLRHVLYNDVCTSVGQGGSNIHMIIPSYERHSALGQAKSFPEILQLLSEIVLSIINE